MFKHADFKQTAYKAVDALLRHNTKHQKNGVFELTFTNILSLHVFECNCSSSCNQHCITLPALMLLFTGLAPHHTEVTHSILDAVRPCRMLRGWRRRGSPLRAVIHSCNRCKRSRSKTPVTNRGHCSTMLTIERAL